MCDYLIANVKKIKNKIKNKIESNRNSRRFIWKTAVSLKDDLPSLLKEKKLLNHIRFKLESPFWTLRRELYTKIDVTLLYLNYKRRNQLLKILKVAKNQSRRFDIFVIDNSSRHEDHAINPSGIKLIKSDNSNQCWERWIHAKKVCTKYVCVMDDDLIFTKGNIIESCYNYMESNPDVDCVGAFGVQYDDKKGYWDSLHLKYPEKDTEVSIIKGRFMFVRTKSLQGLDMKPDLTCDDIKVSSHLNKKVLLKDLAEGFRGLRSGPEAVSSFKDHNSKREKAAKKYFRNKKNQFI